MFDDPEAKAFYEKAAKKHLRGSKPTMQEIVERVSKSRGVPVEEIMGNSRVGPIAEARQSAMWLVRTEGFSFPQVARFFKRDHTTILHACHKIDAQILEGFEEPKTIGPRKKSNSDRVLRVLKQGPKAGYQIGDEMGVCASTAAFYLRKLCGEGKVAHIGFTLGRDQNPLNKAKLYAIAGAAA